MKVNHKPNKTHWMGTTAVMLILLVAFLFLGKAYSVVASPPFVLDPEPRYLLRVHAVTSPTQLETLREARMQDLEQNLSVRVSSITIVKGINTIPVTGSIATNNTAKFRVMPDKYFAGIAAIPVTGRLVGNSSANLRVMPDRYFGQ
jgi:hypothetical protein